MVRWSFKYGLCTHSCVAFARFGTILCSMGNLGGGIEYAVVAYHIFYLEQFHRLNLRLILFIVADNLNNAPISIYTYEHARFQLADVNIGHPWLLEFATTKSAML